MEAVLNQLEVRATVTGSLPDLESLLALSGEMITPGRADNFILPLDGDALNRLLRNPFANS